MTFSDIFKSSFLENVTSVSILDMALALGLSFAIGLFIFLIYRKTYAGVMYSASFGVTLVGLTIIAANADLLEMNLGENESLGDIGRPPHLPHPGLPSLLTGFFPLGIMTL